MHSFFRGGQRNQRSNTPPAQPAVQNQPPAAPSPQPSAPIDQPSGIVKSAADYKAPEIKPTLREVKPDETVESRLNKLTKKDSLYMTNAREKAKRLSASRGLINTSMAAQAGAGAGIEAALPIAQADARTASEAAVTNQSAQNDFLKNRQSANLNMETAGQQSLLSREEQTQLNELTMKRDQGLSQLTREEQQQLNDLTMRRDAGLNNLNIQRDAASSELAKGEESWKNQLNMQRDNNSAALNSSLAELTSTLKKGEQKWSIDLKTRADQILNNDKYSQEIKRMYVNTINTISKDSQQQIVDIGLSDRSAEAQASAIKMVEVNRDSGIKVYEDLLAASPDWSWGTDFRGRGAKPVMPIKATGFQFGQSVTDMETNYQNALTQYQQDLAAWQAG